MLNDLQDLQTPSSFETSWEEAEAHIMDYLTRATNTHLGKDALIGFNPGIVNCWCWNFNSISIGQIMYAPDQPAISLPAYIDVAYQDRTTLQKFVMTIVKALPAHNFGNVLMLRFQENGINEIIPDAITVMNEDEKVGVYTIRLYFDVVFATGGASGSLDCGCRNN